MSVKLSNRNIPIGNFDLEYRSLQNVGAEERQNELEILLWKYLWVQNEPKTANLSP